MKLRAAGIAIGLFLLTLLTFWPVVRCGFVNYDDPDYISQNPRVQGGLTWGNVGYAFSHPQAGNYQPLTFVSLMLDRTLWGTAPAGFHATNLVLHALNAVLVFLVLRAMTGMTWRAGIVAAIFALHPLRVESVAWACERKDVLAAFFGLCALAMYVRYARRPGVGGLAAVGALFALSLMAKATWMTLPVLLLLLDFWPLGRVALEKRFGDPPSAFPRRPMRAIVWEKAPLVGLSVMAALATLAAQHDAAALGDLNKYPFADRVANALVGYARYLGKIVWPAKLAVFYPHRNWSMVAFAAAMGCIVALTAGAMWRWRKSPGVTIGWLWFVIALLPMIGLIQSGAQSMADRFTYLPMIGLLVAVAWAVPWRWVEATGVKWAVGAGVAGLLIALGMTTRAQIAHWRDSVALFEHAIAVTVDNHVAHNNLAFELARLGRTYDAQRHYEEALRISPRYATAHNGLGALLAGRGDSAAAMTQYELALQANPDYALAHRNLASQLLASGRADAARTHLQRAVELRPDDARAQELLGIDLAGRGRVREALPHFEAAVALDPANAQAQVNLGRALVEVGRADDALPCFDAALRAEPNLAEAHYHAGEALARLGRLEAAAEEFRKVLALDPSDATARAALEQVMAHLRSASAGE